MATESINNIIGSVAMLTGIVKANKELFKKFDKDQRTINKADKLQRAEADEKARAEKLADAKEFLSNLNRNVSKATTKSDKKPAGGSEEEVRRDKSDSKNHETTATSSIEMLSGMSETYKQTERHHAEKSAASRLLNLLQSKAAIKQISDSKSQERASKDIKHMSHQNWAATTQVAKELVRIHSVLVGDTKDQARSRLGRMSKERAQSLEKEANLDNDFDTNKDNRKKGYWLRKKMGLSTHKFTDLTSFNKELNAAKSKKKWGAELNSKEEEVISMGRSIDKNRRGESLRMSRKNKYVMDGDNSNYLGLSEEQNQEVSLIAANQDLSPDKRHEKINEVLEEFGVPEWEDLNKSEMKPPHGTLLQGLLKGVVNGGMFGGGMFGGEDKPLGQMKRAPKGGIEVGGKFFEGGQFLPGNQSGTQFAPNGDSGTGMFNMSMGGNSCCESLLSISQDTHGMFKIMKRDERRTIKTNRRLLEEKHDKTNLGGMFDKFKNKGKPNTGSMVSSVMGGVTSLLKDAGVVVGSGATITGAMLWKRLKKMMKKPKFLTKMGAWLAKRFGAAGIVAMFSGPVGWIIGALAIGYSIYSLWEMLDEMEKEIKEEIAAEDEAIAVTTTKNANITAALLTDYSGNMSNQVAVNVRPGGFGPFGQRFGGFGGGARGIMPTGGGGRGSRTDYGQSAGLPSPVQNMIKTKVNNKFPRNADGTPNGGAHAGRYPGETYGQSMKRIGTAEREYRLDLISKSKKIMKKEGKSEYYKRVKSSLNPDGTYKTGGAPAATDPKGQLGLPLKGGSMKKSDSGFSIGNALLAFLGIGSAHAYWKDGDNIADSLAGRGVIGGGDTRWGNSETMGSQETLDMQLLQYMKKNKRVPTGKKTTSEMLFTSPISYRDRNYGMMPQMPADMARALQYSKTDNYQMMKNSSPKGMTKEVFDEMLRLYKNVWMPTENLLKKKYGKHADGTWNLGTKKLSNPYNLQQKGMLPTGMEFDPDDLTPIDHRLLQMMKNFDSYTNLTPQMASGGTGTLVTATTVVL